MSVNKTVRLELSQPRIYGNYEDIEDADRDERPSKTLTIPFAVWRKVVGLAETTGFPVTSNPRHLLPAQTAELAKCLRAAQAAPPPTGKRAQFTATGQLREFFTTPAHARYLAKVVSLVGQGGSLTVAD